MVGNGYIKHFSSEKHNPEACKGCMYVSLSRNWCNYSDITGQSRLKNGGPLHPNGGCSLYSKGEIRPRRSLDFSLPPKREDEIPKLARTYRETRIEIIYTQIEDLYNKGLCDEHIAKECGCNPKTVYGWRKRRGLESNFVKERKAKARRNGR